jgi:phage regulator Rha-like protein
MSKRKTGLILVRGSDLYTTSLIISEQFDRPHFRVLRTIDRLENRGKLTTILKLAYIDSTGRERPYYELDERSALIAMPFIGGSKAEDGQATLVDAFLSMRAELRRQERIRAENQANPIWQKLRADTKEAFRYVNLVLQETRKLHGKETAERHYINEARLCNGVLAGRYQGLDRDLLAPEQLALLEEIQRENSRLLIQGKTYQERKQALLDKFVLKLTEMPN